MAPLEVKLYIEFKRTRWHYLILLFYWLKAYGWLRRCANKPLFRYRVYSNAKARPEWETVQLTADEIEQLIALPQSNKSF